MDLNLFPQLRWAPHLIQAVNEEDEEAVLPLDERLIHQLPPIHGPDFALPIRDRVAVPIQSFQSYVNKPEDWRRWPEYEGMDYVGVQEDNEEEWNLLEQLEVEPEEILKDDTIVEDKSSQHGPIAVDFPTKPGPIASVPDWQNNKLLQDINSSTPRIATIGLQDLEMPDVLNPVFVPTLEPRSHQ